MATATEARTQLRSAVDAVAGSEMADAYTQNVALPTGSKDWQVRLHIEQREFDSENAYERIRAEVTVASDVGPNASASEVQALVEVQSLLLAPSFWRPGVAAIREVVELPNTTEMERNGNVIHFTVACVATLNV